MSKTLLFGNGIALNFAYSEYNYDALVKKFSRGMKIALKKDNEVSGYLAEVKQFVQDVTSSLDNGSNFNESVFWNVYINALNMKIAYFNNGLPSYYKKMGFGTPKEMIDYVHGTIDRNEVKSNLNEYASQQFTGAYNLVRYALLHAIGINEKYDGYIHIPYSEDFIDFCRSFDKVTTTNYITDLEKNGITVDYLHGRVFKKENFSFEDRSESTGERIGEGNEFKQGAKMLFGSNYNDKIRLNSVLNWGTSDLKRIEIFNVLPQNIFKDSDVDILGMSPEADQELIKFILSECNKCTIYFYSEKDKNDWLPFKTEKVELLAAKKLPFIK